jgi:phosphoglycolate phosphatase
VERPLVIFDFDGTLCNSIDYGIKLANSYAKKFNYKPLENFEDVRAQSAVNYIFSNIKWYYIPFWAYVMKRDIQKFTHKIKLYNGILDQLKSIFEIAEIGIISGGKPNYIKEILEKNDALHFISFIHGDNGTKKHKLLKHYSHRNLVHIGDDIEDIRSSNKADVKSIAVTWGTSSELILQKENPTKLISSPSDLFNCLNTLFRSKEISN